MKTWQNEKGFTLVELMIVIAIIGILVTIAIPSLRNYLRQGYNSSAMSDLRNTVTAQVAISSIAQQYGVLSQQDPKADVTTLKATDVTDSGVVLGGNSTKSNWLATVMASNSSVPRFEALSVSNGVTLAMAVDVPPKASPNPLTSAYNIMAKHANGNAVFASDSDFMGSMYQNEAAEFAKSGVSITKSDVPAAVVSTNEFQGAENWTIK